MSTQTLEEIRAKRAEIEERREAKAKADEEAAELARETKALADDEALEAAEQEHGRDALAVIETPEGRIIVKRPKAATYRKFVDSGKTDTETLDKLVAPCLVHPGKEEYRRLIDTYPHVAIIAANQVVKLAGMRDAKKD